MIRRSEEHPVEERLKMRDGNGVVEVVSLEKEVPAAGIYINEDISGNGISFYYWTANMPSSTSDQAYQFVPIQPADGSDDKQKP